MSERNMNWKWCPFIKHTINSNWNHRTDKNELCHYLFKQVLYLMFVCPCIASISLKYNQQDATFSRSIYFYKLLHVFQAVPPPIIGSTKLCIQHQVLSNRYCCLLLSWMRWHCSSISSTIAAVSVWQYLTLYVQFCAPDDGRRNRLKHAEQFIEINRSRKHCILLVVLQRYTCDAWTYECQIWISSFETKAVLSLRGQVWHPMKTDSQQLRQPTSGGGSGQHMSHN